MVSGTREACRWLGSTGEGEREGGREEGRAQGGAKVESERQKLSLFTPKGEERTPVQVGASAYPRISVSSPCPPVRQPGAWLLWLAGPPPPPTCPPAPPCLSPPAKGRAISLPMDLDAHISSLLSSGATCMATAQRSASNYKATTRAFPRVPPAANQWDYKNIIEKLQVGAGLPGICHGSCFGRVVPGKRPFLRCPHSPGKRPLLRAGPGQGTEGHRSRGIQENPGLR